MCKNIWFLQSNSTWASALEIGGVVKVIRNIRKSLKKLWKINKNTELVQGQPLHQGSWLRVALLSHMATDSSTCNRPSYS